MKKEPTDLTGSVEPTITDANGTAASIALESAAALSHGEFFQAVAQSLGLTAHDAAQAQINGGTLLLSSTVQEVDLLLGASRDLEAEIDELLEADAELG